MRTVLFLLATLIAVDELEFSVIREPATTFFFSERDLAMSEIPAAADELVPAVEAEAARLALHVTGRMVFVYLPPAQPGEGRLRLHVALPVAVEKPGCGPAFAFRQAPAQRFLCLQHRGPAAAIGETWSALWAARSARGLAQGDESREIYWFWDGVESPHNVVLLQLAIGGPEADAAPAPVEAKPSNF